jgi:hypothetical protein
MGVVAITLARLGHINPRERVRYLLLKGGGIAGLAASPRDYRALQRNEPAMVSIAGGKPPCDPA